MTFKSRKSLGEKEKEEYRRLLCSTCTQITYEGVLDFTTTSKCSQEASQQADKVAAEKGKR